MALLGLEAPYGRALAWVERADGHLKEGHVAAAAQRAHDELEQLALTGIAPTCALCGGRFAPSRVRDDRNATAARHGCHRRLRWRSIKGLVA